MTTEELIKEKNYWFFETLPGNQDIFILKEDIPELMIKFARYHVKQALQEALDSIPCLGSSTDIPTYEEVENEVLNSYSLDNIK